MRNTVTRWIGIGVAAVGVAGVGHSHSESIEDLGLDVWNLPKLNQEMEACRRKAEEMDDQFRATTGRVNAKLATVDQLREGTLTYREAAVRFRNLNTAYPKFVEMAQRIRPGMSADECHYRSVLDCVRLAGPTNPDDAPLLARLTAELNDLKSRGELNLDD